MVTVRQMRRFRIKFNKIKDARLVTTIKKQIDKLIADPTVGKPMQYDRQGTRELYISPFRMSYAYLPSEDVVLLLDLYHKKKQ
jgi:mRNA-degrading endonuclease RelE of RelBE toxin-antitoxin system